MESTTNPRNIAAGGGTAATVLCETNPAHHGPHLDEGGEAPPRRRTSPAVLAGCLAAAFAAGGCQKVVFFPETSMDSVAKAFGARGAYDTNGDGLADFFTFADADGRITRIAYEGNGSGRPGAAIDLDAIAFDKCRHLFIILDGVGYEVLKDYHDSGGLAWFHAPSRVICPYPSMTDTAIADLLNCGQCPANEALYFDRAKNEMVGGSRDYLAGRNMPYNQLLHYRAGMLDDALGYLWPRGIFRGEIDNLKRVFDQHKTQEVLAYMVSSAGMGTKYGKEGQVECLRKVDQLVNQIMWETRGMTKVTLTADHGHSYTPATRIPLEKALKEKGWNVTDRLSGPRDVVYIRFGLETYAALYTNSPKALAEDLIRTDGVELASYAESRAGKVWVADPQTKERFPVVDSNIVDRCVVVLGHKDPNGRFRHAAAPPALAEDPLTGALVPVADDANITKTWADSNGRKAPNNGELTSPARAVVARHGDGYSYEVSSGDPLKVYGILHAIDLVVRMTEGISPLDHEFCRHAYYEANMIFRETLDGYYPAPLERLWRAHYGLVKHTPDVIISLEDRFYSGADTFAGAVKVASTHGGLNRRNSTAFIMSTTGPLPQYMRSAEVPANMTRMTGAKWPQGR